MKKLSITLHVEMPEDFGTPDSMADMSIAELMEQVRKEVEYTCYTSTDAAPHLVKVDLVINGEVATQPDQQTQVSVQTVVQTQTQTQNQTAVSGVLSVGTRVVVTFQEEQTSAEVIGYDYKYRLHKVRTSCGKVLLRKIHTAA
jgi:hypothetical protein